MPVSYLDFHASIPVTAESPQMELRNSVSRNHYAILHYLIEYANKMNISDSVYVAGAHQRVIDAISDFLKDSGEERIRKSLKAIFTDSKSKRTKADYFLNEDIQLWEARQVCGALERIQGLLEPEQVKSVSNE